VTHPRLRPFLGALAAYKPGRRPAPGQQLARLASNEVPYPLLPEVVEAVAKALVDGNRYPDPTVAALTARLAAKHGLPAEQLIVGCGSNQLLQELITISCDAGEQVVFGWRSFEAYPGFTAIAGAVAVRVPLTAMALDLPAMAAAITDRTRLVLLCSPNNPTGTAITAVQMRAFLAQVPTDVLVALDEAYAEFVDDPAVVNGFDLLAEHPNLVVLRTFSKAYGLAGLRVGYAVGSAEVIGALRQVHLPFSVTLAAQAAALASLDVEPALLAQVAAVVALREPFRRELLALGWDVPPTQGNFVWLPAGPDSDRLSQVLEDHGVLVRCFSGEGLRITIARAEDNARVLSALRD
jgi:histidinol-phosphate aminotransferase